MIRLLIDENLPASLVRRLPADAVHATTLGVSVSDRSLWEMARDQGRDILTRDADFFDRLMLEGPPPRVIWVRLGNLRRTTLEDMLVARWSKILALLERFELVEIHPNETEGISASGDGSLTSNQ